MLDFSLLIWFYWQPGNLEDDFVEEYQANKFQSHPAHLTMEGIWKDCQMLQFILLLLHDFQSSLAQHLLPGLDFLQISICFIVWLCMKKISIIWRDTPKSEPKPNWFSSEKLFCSMFPMIWNFVFIDAVVGEWPKLFEIQV